MAPPKRSGSASGGGRKPGIRSAGGAKPAPRGTGGGGQGRGGQGGQRRGAGTEAESRSRWSQASTGIGGEQIEGRHAVRELLLAERRKVKEIWVSSGMDDAEIIDEIVDMARERRISVHEVSRSRLDAAAKSDNPQGIMALAQPLVDTPLETMCDRHAGNPFLLALDGVTDPHNVGSLIRTGECAGITGVVFPAHRSAHVTPTVAKVSAGAVEHLPFALVPGIPAGMATAKKAGVWTVGLDMDGDTDIDELTVADQPLMLIMGAEGAGLSRLARQRCDVVARIPQYGSVSSLNVAAAGAIACFAVARQRAKAGF